MFVLCFSTVFSLTPSKPAMSLFLWPSATILRIWRSRWVSVSQEDAVLRLFLPVGKSVVTLSAMSGLRYLAPGENFVDGPDQFLVRRILQDVAVCSVMHGSENPLL